MTPFTRRTHHIQLPTLVLCCALLATLAVACHKSPQPKRVLPGVPTGEFSELSESTLNAIIICHDTLGQPDNPRHHVENPRCAPCIPFGAWNNGDWALTHARRLWNQGARAPYDTLDMGANCVQLAYRIAQKRYPHIDTVAVEIALFQLFDSQASLRRRALEKLDSLLGQRFADGDLKSASAMLSQLADGMWDRAQRQLERPAGFDENTLERRAHDLYEGAPTLVHMPNVPYTSKELGVSEAEWAARLYTAAARLSESADRRSHNIRLALSPWLALNDWEALDSASRAFLVMSPRDSVIWPAIALAAYQRMTHLVNESPRVMALFDSALWAMPRADSMRYDSFDGILARTDDDWRYGLFPDIREKADTRGWVVLDPLWSTPINEIRLARRARIAEADFRFADIAKPGQAGSETPAGEMLLRLGSPDSRWRLQVGRFGVEDVYFRQWSTLLAATKLRASQTAWRVFYGPYFSIDRVAGRSVNEARALREVGESGRRPAWNPCSSVIPTNATLHDCALTQRADWTGQPFYGTTDTVDVTVARFRAGGDSTDVYIGSRLPLRGFKNRDDLAANAAHRIRSGVWITTSLGQPVFHAESADPLPAPNTIASYNQWRSRIGPTAMMHRVEGIEVTRQNGARGAMRYTSDSLSSFVLRGFGMSDVLVAASIKLRGAVANRWTDLESQPNGAVVTPGQRFALAWELYDLTPGPDGRVRWRVRISRERGNVIAQNDLKAIMSGSRTAGTRVLADEKGAPDFSYDRDAAAAPAVIDYLSAFGFPDIADGRHVVIITVTDLVSGKSVSSSAAVRVLNPAAQRRGTSRFDTTTPSVRRRRSARP